MQFPCKHSPAVMLLGSRSPPKWIVLCCSVEVLNRVMNISKLKPSHWLATVHMHQAPYPVSKAAGGLWGLPAAPSWSTDLSPEISHLNAYCVNCLDLRITLHLSIQFWDDLWCSDTNPNFLFLPQSMSAQGFLKMGLLRFPKPGNI